MATKIRLQRHGRKGKPFFHIVVADARSKRDGRNIEKLGTYNPNTDPATIEINFDSAVNWVMNGAQPTDTARAILKYKGVMMKKHLLDGIKKGAHTEEEAEKKFENWLNQKTESIGSKKERLAKEAEDARQKAMEAEAAVNKAREESRTAQEAPAAEEGTEAPEAEERGEVEAAADTPADEAPEADTAANNASEEDKQA